MRRGIYLPIFGRFLIWGSLARYLPLFEKGITIIAGYPSPSFFSLIT